MTTTAQPPRGRRPDAPAGRDRAAAGTWTTLALVIGLLIMVVPFIWMVLGSFKTTAELRQVPPTWWPGQDLDELPRDLFSRQNSAATSSTRRSWRSAVTVGNLLFCSMLGYALAKLEFPGKRILFVVVLATLMVPAVVTFMPLFVAREQPRAW